MDDQVLIQQTIPEGWQVEAYQGRTQWVLSPGNHQGFVTVDLKQRIWMLGIGSRRRTAADPVFGGRNWKVALVNAAVAGLNAAIAGQPTRRKE